METGSLKCSGFHWRSLNSPSLAELLLGKEKTSLPPAGHSEEVSLSAIDAAHLFPVGFSIAVQWYMHERDFFFFLSSKFHFNEASL